MRPTELLLQYQRLGDRSRVLLDEKQRLEDRLNRHEKIEAAEAAVAAAETQLSELTRRFKAMDLEVEGHRGKMHVHERELMSGRIRSPTDLTKMSEEVSHMKARLLEEEEAELQLMTALEETEGELERADAQCESLLGYVDRYHEADKRGAILEERIRADRSIEIAYGVAAGHDPFAVLRGAAGTEHLVVGIVEANGAQELGH